MPTQRLLLLECGPNAKLLEELSESYSIHGEKWIVNLSGHDVSSGLREWRAESQYKEVRGKSWHRIGGSRQIWGRIGGGSQGLRVMESDRKGWWSMGPNNGGGVGLLGTVEAGTQWEGCVDDMQMEIKLGGSGHGAVVKKGMCR